MSGGRLEVALLVAALCALALLAGSFIANVRPAGQACSGNGHELAGTCYGSNPGHTDG